MARLLQNHAAARERGLRVLVFVFVAYVAAPIRDIPFLGRSLSLFVFLLLASEVMLRRGGLRHVFLRQRWAGNALAVWGGIAVAAFVGSLTLRAPGITFAASMKYILGYGYWMAVFLTMPYLIVRYRLGWLVLNAAAAGASMLAMLVVVEFAAGIPEMLTHLAQNVVGILFSTFGVAPLAVALFAPRRRWLGAAGFALVALAVALNASRGSWIAVGLATLVLLSLDAWVRRRYTGFLIGVLMSSVALAGWSALPSSSTEKFTRRSETLRDLDRDKSFQMRLVLNRKAVALFLRYPVFGIGPGGFYFYSVDVELPRSLRSRGAEINRAGAHNAYGQLMAEGGLVCVVPFGILLLRLAFGGLRATTRLARCGEVWGLAFFAMFVGVSMHLLVLSGLGSTQPWMVYGLVAGAISAAAGAEPVAAWAGRGVRPVGTVWLAAGTVPRRVPMARLS